jgi:hypothetical protein
VTVKRAVVVLTALVAALLATGVAGLGPLTPIFYRPISISASGGVAEIGIQPIPEGPPGPVFARTPVSQKVRSLALIEAFIPDPLPAPLNQWFCRQGGDLTIVLGNGRQVTYGPCYRPASIDRLWAEIVYVDSNGQCAPKCGPEGAPGP